MWCPHDIGRDSWVWGEQETLWSMNSPTKWGMKPSPFGSRCREETGWPSDKMVVVVVVVVAVVVGCGCWLSLVVLVGCGCWL